MLAASLAVVRKDLTDAVRNPLLTLIGIVVPIVFVSMFALVIHTSATNPIALAVDSDGPSTRRFVETLSTIDSSDGDFFRVVTTDSAAAERRLTAGDVPAVVHIPATFERDVAAGARPAVRLRLGDIDSDGAKNIELRLAHAIRTFAASTTLDIREERVFPTDPPMRSYFGAALLMFAAIFLGMTNTGVLIAGEWDQGTAKSVVLSPLGFAPLLLGKWAAAATQTAVTWLVVAAVVTFGLGFPLAGLGPVSAVVLLVLFAYGAALGALFGVKLKSSLALIPAAAVVSVLHLLVAGFESYIRGFAHGGALEWLWRAGAVWPVSGLTDAVRRDAVGVADAGAVAAHLSVTIALALVLTALAVRHLGRELTFAQGM